MVEYLTIQDTKYPVRIGYSVMKHVKAKTGLSFSEALQKASKEEDLEIYETILYHALKMGAFAETGKAEIPFNEEDMEMVLDLCLYDLMPLFRSESFFPKKQVEEMERALEEAEKKEKAARTTKMSRKKT